jgi:hypothetical protein
MENPFHIDEDAAHDGFLYVNVDDLCTVRIYRAPGGVEVEICPLDNTDRALGAVRVGNRRLRAANAKLNPSEST